MRAGSVVRAGVPALSALGINAVPVSGAVFGGWSAETTLAVYIVETALLVAVTALRLWLMAPPRLVTASGKTQSRGETIQGFLLVTGGFTVGGAIFSAFFLWRSVDPELVLRAIAASLPVFVVVQLLALVADLLLLRQASQAVVERWMLPGLRRGCVLYGAVFLGAAAAVFGLGAYIYPFIALKLFFDIGGALEEAVARVRGVAPPSPGLLEITVKRKP